MNYKKIFVFILCVLLAVAAAAPFSGAFASEERDAVPAAEIPAADENVLAEDQPVTVIEDVADGTVVTVGEPEPAADPIADPAAAPTPEVKTLTDNYVTVTGLLPAETELQAERISDPFAQPAPKKSGKNLFKSALRLNADTDAAPAADEQSDSAEDSWKAVAFYDIKLIDGGTTVQPDGTVTVTIENVPLSNDGSVVTVRHFLDSEDAVAAALAAGRAQAVRDASYAAAFPDAAAAAEAATGESGVVYMETIGQADGLRVNGTTVTFPATSFSIYAVGETPSLYRLNVVFHRADGTDVTLPVKLNDIDNLSEVIYDPGSGGSAEQVFRGWYTADDSDNPVDIDAVRDMVRTKLQSGVSADITETMEFYPSFLSGYTVIFKDENGSVMSIETVDAEDDLEISLDYTPLQQNAQFMGWMINGDDSQLYNVGQKITNITANLVATPKLKVGQWLIFKSNAPTGSGAAYIAPRIVEGGQNASTVKPAEGEMYRPGYVLVGWYRDAAGTTSFNWNSPITSETTIYAKWEPDTSVSYSVVIWAQLVTDHKNSDAANKHYSYVNTESGSAPAGTAINDALVAPYKNYGNAYFGVNDLANGSTGFRYSHYTVLNDADNTISGRGNTIINVYYDRELFTIYFEGIGNDDVYVPTTATSGTLYGFVDGNYVLLTASGTEKYLQVTSTAGTLLSPNPTTIYLSTANANNQTNGIAVSSINIPNNATVGTSYRYLNASTMTVANSGSSMYRHYGSNSNRQVYLKVFGRSVYTYNGEEYTGQLYEKKQGNSFTGLYGQEFSMYGYEWPSPGAGNHWSNITFLNSFSGNLFGHSNLGATKNYIHTSIVNNANTTIFYYREKVDGTGYEKVAESTYDLTTTSGFNITNRFTGTEPSGYRWSTSSAMPGTWNSAEVMQGSTTDGISSAGITNVKRGNNGYLHIKYDRVRNDILYSLEGQTSEIATGVPYEKPLSEYEALLPETPDSELGYYFVGWFQDEACSVPMDWDITMPANNLTVYGKIAPMRYRIVLHSCGGVIEGSNLPDGSSTFRADNGETASVTKIERDGYSFIGWYTDPSYSASSAFLLSTEIYENTQGMNMNYQSSADWQTYGIPNGDEDNVRGILHLYAKWRSKLDGADGINVEYDTDGWTPVPTDDTLYQDASQAFAKSAPTTAPAGDTRVFKYWIVMDYENGEYQETEEHVLPSNLFTVRLDYAKEEDLTATTKKYTVKLKAFYGPAEQPGTTFIKYDGNGGTLKTGFTPPTGATVDANGGITFADLQINATHTTLPADTYTREGYTFLGWSQSATATAKEFDAEQEVAADNLDPTGNTLYAVWEENQVTLNYVAVGPEGVESGFGSVDPASETVGAVNGEPEGSTATVGGNTYRFVGWFDNADCTGEPLSTDLAYAPTKAQDELWVDGTTYYAKFDYNTTTLTISKTGMASGEGAIFTVTGPGYENGLTVAVPNGESVTIANVLIGSTYQVVEKGDWSWRYSQQTASSGALTSSGGTVSVTNSKTITKWLSGSDCAVNKVSNQ